MLPFQVALEELCIQKPKSCQRAEGHLLPAQESCIPPDYSREGRRDLQEIAYEWVSLFRSHFHEVFNKVSSGI